MEHYAVGRLTIRVDMDPSDFPIVVSRDDGQHIKGFSLTIDEAKQLVKNLQRSIEMIER